ncbi:TetR family transcriptional regulator [Blastomonas natatoria]|uniref:TetR family transcriptional regulator n=1 Tax=Blastomonas natatoria TaxID=34015 RepID=A0A2V3VBE6_9SPHN|nr:TetR/AcrR family transcriptional regulator [Blastomonas natatoria]PXW78151.1 TetR family transcriptional regulator [Blastomonas natatoria]
MAARPSASDVPLAASGGEGARADKTPRTARGRATLRKLLDAAAIEFGERGFHEASISGITRRAGTALGSFYTYFDSKDEIFRALVQDMSAQVGKHAATAMQEASGSLDRERAALKGFLEFAREHKEIYRIIDEAEFVDSESYRAHYQVTATRILSRLQAGADAGEIRGDVSELHAWAVMGMNVFLGLRYGIWSEDMDADAVASAANDFITRGLKA